MIALAFRENRIKNTPPTSSWRDEPRSTGAAPRPATKAPFVVDGIWRLAGKILKLSKNLQSLPRVSFTPRELSNFRVKKQPRAEYLSTLESIHLLLELGREQGAENTEVDFDLLPRIFKRLVDIQIESRAVGYLLLSDANEDAGEGGTCVGV